MELKLLNIKQILISKINKEEAIKKKLIINDNCEIYLKVQALYKKIFDNYIDSIININEEIDKKMKNSKLDYGEIPENKKNIYHNFSNWNSSYIFIRNFFYIERLEKEQLEKFIDQINKDDVSEELVQIVKLTFKDIIKKVSFNKTEESFKVNYGVAIPINMFDNDSLVLYINYWKNDIKLEGKEFIDNKIKKEAYLNELIEKLKLKFETELSCKTEIRYYKGIIL